MTEHYYTQNPEVARDEHTWQAILGDHKFVLTTDSGVFSKTQVDYGSKVLMRAAGQTNFELGPLLDMGCGYGPIGLYLAKKFPGHMIHMVDINQRAVELAQKNAIQNDIENVRIYPSDCYQAISERNFAGILINPPIRAGKVVVHDMIKQSRDYLISDGRLQIVIQKKQGAPSAKKKMQEVYGNVQRIALDKGYWILESVKSREI